jgi:hypothetical protein
MPSQRYSIPWNATDDLGRGVASGIYFYTLQAGAYKATRKLVVMK